MTPKTFTIYALWPLATVYAMMIVVFWFKVVRTHRRTQR